MHQVVHTVALAAFPYRMEFARRARRGACAALLLGAAMAIAAPAQTFTTLVNFNGTNGSLPQYMSLVQGTDGNLYGTTGSGGPITSGIGVDYGGQGTIFKMTPAGALTTLYTFDPNTEATTGGVPEAGLIQASDGNFYGTTFGVAYYGSVFKITPGGTFTTLHVFNNTDGAAPMAPLVQGTDGNFYGTTSGQGAASGAGTVFRITPSGELTTLYRFCAQSGCSDGNVPEGGLILAKDGNLYGTTLWGGTNATGAIYKITPAGQLTTLYSFGLSGGAEPMGNLVQGEDGNFYGTTSLNNVEGVPQVAGTVFKMTPAGSVTTLYTFSGMAAPNAGLIQASDGNFYGTTAYGGTNGYGSIFEITPAGVLTTLHSFDSSAGDGVTPLSGLVQASDGKLYGTTSSNATASNGTVFSESIGAIPPPAPAISSGGIITAGAFGAFPSAAPGSWIEIYGANLAADARLWAAADFNGINAPTSLDKTTVTVGGQSAVIYYISPAQVNAQVPPNTGTGPQPVVVSSAAGASPAVTITINPEEPGLSRTRSVSSTHSRSRSRQLQRVFKHPKRIPNDRSHVPPVQDCHRTTA